MVSDIEFPAGVKAEHKRRVSRERKTRQLTGRLRFQSQSPNKKPSTALSLSSDDSFLTSLRNKVSDSGVEYPRKRATIACELCRSRKSRCDSIRPKCKLCTELGADCVYREPGVKLDAGDKLILEHLNRIENLLHKNLTAVDQTKGIDISQNSPSTSNDTAMKSDCTFVPESFHTNAAIRSGGFSTCSSVPTAPNISTMPKSHTNATIHLLLWPFIRDLVPQPYDSRIFLQLEMAREPLRILTQAQCVDLSKNRSYIKAYFDRVNIWYACINPLMWPSQYRTALSSGFREGPESCIVLLVLALGEASLRESISRVTPQETPPGMQYFMAAGSLLPEMITSNDILAAQCHLLAAAYLFYLVRPLEAWNLLCITSTKLQLLLMAPDRIPVAQRELVVRIYWNTLLFESDLLAELDLPHSGAVQLEETIGLPGRFEGEDQDQVRDRDHDQDQGQDQCPVGKDELWYFLAEIALRRLLNRVSQLIYSKDSKASPTNLKPVVAELDFQLTQWYESLPQPLQFPFSRSLLQDPVQAVLRLRFYACKTIIYRPYVLAVLEDEPTVLDPAVRECCHKCLEASVLQLENIREYHAGRMPYLWQGALSIVSQLLLLMGSSMCPSLLNILLTILPHQQALDNLISEVIMEMGQYASLAPSLALAIDIVKEAEKSRQAFRTK
ncbi:hypothetical protein E4U13_000414 [Claviceps humidiphila]|uniref:Zn(2)-C6 fungal-type domain-containing protein n=1 Tax=Claviceps humidiphila TaxID=1294629 RepID=A0A9P7Q7D7_9HYPO|nr:hypothetical protein E4U13_000414 [Claviceps humidiphila]